MSEREHFTSRWAFLLSTMGAAVGLGNLWRFPFMAGQNGGGAFVLIYLLCVLMVALPIVLAELSLGRLGQKSPVESVRTLIPPGRSRGWRLTGWLSIFIPLLGLSYYSVVAGWAVEYIGRALSSGEAIDSATSESTFNALLSSPVRMLVLHSLFVGSAAWVVGRGVHRGIEAASKVLMPLLFLILLSLVAYSAFTADFGAAWTFLFAPSVADVSVSVIFMALGQAFFSVAIGVGVLMTYGSYMPRQFSLPGSAVVIVCVDTLVALLAGLAIFPIVFANQLDPAGGPGLIFVTLPIAFSQIPGGEVFGAAFFALFLFAAFTTATGMLEPAVSWFVDRGFSRQRTVWACATACWMLGIAAILSFNVWQDVRLIPWIGMLADKDIFSLFDFVVSNALLPLNALLIALFAGWVVSRKDLRVEVAMVSERLSSLWLGAVRWLAPVAIVCILVFGLVS